MSVETQLMVILETSNESAGSRLHCY